MTITGHNGGNSRRAQDRVRSCFAARWAPWQWCQARTHWPDGPSQRCRLRRGHLGRHAVDEGKFSVRFFDTAREGTP